MKRERLRGNIFVDDHNNIVDRGRDISIDDAPDRDVERKKWTPTSDQFAAYRKRERALAAQNLAALKGRGFSSDTLHSRDTLWRTMQGVG